MLVAWRGKTQMAILLAALIALVLVATTRVFGIWQWAFYGDEFYTIDLATKDIKLGLSLFFNKPSYILINKALFELFGVSEVTARVAPAGFGIAGILAFYYWCRRFLGAKAAIYGTLLLTFHAWHLYHSQFARFYSAVFFFSIIAYFLHLDAFRRGDLRTLTWAVLVTIVAVTFHPSAIGIFVCCTVFAGFLLVSRDVGIGSQTRYLAKIYLWLAAVGAIMFVPFLFNIFVGWQELRQTWGYQPFNQILQLVKYVNVAVFVAAAIALLVLIKKQPLEGWFIAAGMGIPVLLLIAASSFTAVRPDYVIYVLPLFLAMAGYLCAEVDSSLSSVPVAGKAMFLVLWLGLLPGFVSHYTSKITLDIRDAVDYVESHYQEGDKILPMVDGFDYYSRLQGENLPRSAFRADVDWSDTLMRYQMQEGRFWIVVPLRRKEISRNLRMWLAENAFLVWQKQSKRYDYTMEGIQIFLKH